MVAVAEVDANKWSPLLELLAEVLENPSPVTAFTPVTPTKDTTSRRVRGHTRLSAEQRQELVDMYRAGSSIKDICSHFGINKTYAIRVRKQAGIPERQRGMTPEQRSQAPILYESGLSAAAIGERFDVNASTVSAYLRRIGTTMRPVGGSKPRLRADSIGR